MLNIGNAPGIPGITERSATAVVTQALGIRTIGAERLAGSVGNQTFIVRSADGEDVILKTGNRDLLGAELWACQRARNADIPAPKVVAHTLSPTDNGMPYMILRLVVGAATSSPTIWSQAGKSLRLAHQINIPGYGRLSVSSNGASGRHGTWQAALTSILSQASNLVAPGILAQDLVDNASETITSSAIMHYRQPGVMLHRDLKPQHIFGNNGQLTGIIDWGDAGVGDPLFDIARISMAGHDILDAFLEGYELDLTPELDQIIRAYRILWNLEALNFEFRAGGDWFDFYRDNIENDLRRRK